MLTTLVASIPAVLLFLWHINVEQTALLDSAKQQAFRLAEAWAEHHDQRITDAGFLLDEAVRIVSLDASCGDMLKTLARRENWSRPLAIVDANGVILCASAAKLPAPAAFDPAFFDALFDSSSLQVSDFGLGADGHAVALAGLRAPHGRFSKDVAAVTVISLADIQNSALLYAEGSDYNVMVLDRTGRILATSEGDEGAIGQVLPQIHPLRPMINMVTEGATSGRTADGVEKIFAFAQLPQTGAKVVVEMLRSDVLGAQDRAVDTLLVLLLAVALAAGAGAWFVAKRSVLRWVDILGSTAEALGRGELDRRAVIPPQVVEFAALAQRFNQMASALAERQEELEKRVEERTAELLAAQSELLGKERLSALGQLTATVAHELRNPLGAIKNTLFTLRNECAGKGSDAERMIGRIERSIVRCDTIIADLLDYSRERSLRTQPTQFDEWAEEIVREQPLAGAIELALDLRAGDATIALDRERFRRVLVNLVENAAQAIAGNDPAARRGRIAVSTRADEGAIEIAIADNGSGIPDAIHAKIFEPLFSTKNFGTGLGLPVAKRIVEQHGGTIAIDSEENVGTRVTLRLPRPTAQNDGVVQAA